MGRRRKVNRHRQNPSSSSPTHESPGTGAVVRRSADGSSPTSKNRRTDYSLSMINLVESSDVHLLCLLAITAVAFNAYLHEVLLLVFFAAATFAVVRVREHAIFELRPIFKRLGDIKNVEITSNLKIINEINEDWYSLFRISSGIAIFLWFVVAVSVTSAMTDCTYTMVMNERSTESSVAYRFTTPEYWQLPANVNLTAIYIAAVSSTFAFVGATTLVFYYRESRSMFLVNEHFGLIIEKLNS